MSKQVIMTAVIKSISQFVPEHRRSFAVNKPPVRNFKSLSVMENTSAFLEGRVQSKISMKYNFFIAKKTILHFSHKFLKKCSDFRAVNVSVIFSNFFDNLIVSCHFTHRLSCRQFVMRQVQPVAKSFKKMLRVFFLRERLQALQTFLAIEHKFC